MSKRRIRDWAALAEVVGTAAVVVSLIFVILSINQNTRAIEAVEMNNIWTAWREASLLPVVENTEFAAIRHKLNNSQPLTPVEQVQWNFYQSGRLDIWAQLYDLYSGGVISEEKWRYWDDAYWRNWHSAYYDEYWSLSDGAEYDPGFREHVNSRRATIAEPAQ